MFMKSCNTDNVRTIKTNGKAVLMKMKASKVQKVVHIAALCVLLEWLETCGGGDDDDDDDETYTAEDQAAV